MRILTVDDEPLALEVLNNAVLAACPKAQIISFTDPKKLLSSPQARRAQIALLDVRMPEMSGVELAKRLKDLNPAINIIFVTAYDEYAAEALRLHASGYIMKPATAAKVTAEFSDLRHPIAPMPDALLRLRCFGNFEVFAADDTPIHFERTKSKELLAYLVSRRGASSTIREIAAILFEDGKYDHRQQIYLQKIISSMMNTLRQHNAHKAIKKNYNSISLDIDLVDCDYYRFLQLDAAAANAYAGEFMAQYSWAEFITAYLNRFNSSK